MNSELKYQLYRDVRDYLKELESHKAPYVTPNTTHLTLLNLYKRYSKDDVRAEITKQNKANQYDAYVLKNYK